MTREDDKTTLQVNLAAFLAHLDAHDPPRSINYTGKPGPTLEEDLTEGPEAVTIDGWWYATDLEDAIRAAVSIEGPKEEQ